MKKLTKFTSTVSIVLGTAFLVGGLWGVLFTYKSVVNEKIITPSDATISEMPVRGPATLKAQIDIIRHHTLENTEGKTYAEMSREDDRSIWITATTLNTALYQGIMAYGLSAMAVANGIFMILVGLVLSKRRRE